LLFKYKQSLKKPSRLLRRQMTNAEKLLWSKLRRRNIKGCQFNRQKPIDNYIVDFYCCRTKLAIEVDVGQHYEESNEIKDRARDTKLRQFGIKVLRFTNLDVLKNIEGVVGKIYDELNQILLNPPLKRREIKSRKMIFVL